MPRTSCCCRRRARYAYPARCRTCERSRDSSARLDDVAADAIRQLARPVPADGARQVALLVGRRCRRRPRRSGRPGHRDAACAHSGLTRAPGVAYSLMVGTSSALGTRERHEAAAIRAREATRAIRMSNRSDEAVSRGRSQTHRARTRLGRTRLGAGRKPRAREHGLSLGPGEERRGTRRPGPAAARPRRRPPRRWPGTSASAGRAIVSTSSDGRRVGHVDDGGITLAELDLGQDGTDVVLLGDRVGRDGRGEVGRVALESRQVLDGLRRIARDGHIGSCSDIRGSRAGRGLPRSRSRPGCRRARPGSASCRRTA